MSLAAPHGPAGHGGAVDVAGVPDLPAPVLGWRTWRVGRRAQRRAELIAPLAAVPWPARRAMAASCGSAVHAPPGDRCGCGLYAVSDPARLEWGPSPLQVLGVVALWGQVVEGTRGWRASHGYPRFVITGPTIVPEQRAAVARRYGVPVHGSDVPARDLAVQLGTDPALAASLCHGSETEVAALLAAWMPLWTRRSQARRAELEASRRRPTVLGMWRRR